MFRNYFKTVFRNLWKNKFFSIINIAGLAVGLSCFLLIGAYLYTELTYDRYAKDAKDIYRVELHVTGNNTVVDYPNVDAAVGKGMMNVFPEITAYTRLVPYPPVFVHYKEKSFEEDHLALVDSNFLQIFSIPFIEGDAKTALQQPYSIVVTKAFAKKYFGNQDPLGKSLKVSQKNVYKITGVISKIPDRSHFHFDGFMCMSSSPYAMTSKSWFNVGYFTYIVLNKNANPKKLEAKFPKLISKYIAPEIQNGRGISPAEAQKKANTFRFSLMPLTKIHLYSHTKYELEPNGYIQYVYIFSALGLFILLLACVNFINLSTASSSRRAREVGIRKVLGSVKRDLISRFLAESIWLTFCAMILALLIATLLLPYFNYLSGWHLPGNFFLNYKTIGLLFLAVILIGITAGIYPAFFLSAFKTVKVLKGNLNASSGGKGLRSGLVIFQFVISICLIISTIVIYKQLHFMQNKNLGFDKSQVLVIQHTGLLGKNERAFRRQLIHSNQVLNATISNSVPGNKVRDFTQVYPENNDGNENINAVHTNIFHVDYRYIPTLAIKVVRGRNFSTDFPSDSFAVIINQSAANALGWENTNPVGKYVYFRGQKHKVIGEVKDFNYASLKQDVAPMMMMLGRNSGKIIVKIKTTEVQHLLSEIKKTWNSFNPGTSFDYTFLDTKFALLYQAEQKTAQLFTVFAFIAIIIACLGLFGLATFMAYQKTKEIGIRKVLGASVSNVVMLLSKDFMTLVVVAIIIATPIAWLAMNKWLQNFAYRINISWWIFVAAGLLAIVIALITVSFQAIKAARANPVESLRME